MDALASLLDGPRGRGAVLLRTVMRPPWSVRFADRAPLGVIALLRGGGWVTAADGQSCRLEPGAVAVLRGPQEFVFADDPATPQQVVIHPGPRITTSRGDDIGTTMDLGVRTWGNDPHGPDLSLIGCFQMRGEISRRLLDALPSVFVLTSDAWDAPLIPLLASETARDEPGQQAVLDRLFDLLLITVLRAYLLGLDDDAPAWYRAHRDPVVGRAVRMLHDNPAHPWSVSTLAGTAGVSRAKFASRFTTVVGEPPMTYLTSWRLALAADLLHEPDATLEAIARRVGYSNGFALSAAFKRVRGISPTEHRRATVGAGMLER
ncbi:MAG: AraC family transcriptional regulator [Pseudonocardia sp.]|nr:AraC family transcriptional regulator [Pseudonocardia sp.]